MASKPPALPRWATTGVVTEPTSGSKDSGWVDGDPAPAPTANWLENTSYNWLRWLDAGDADHMRALIARVPNLDGTKVPTEPGYDPSTSKFVFAATTASAHPTQGTANNKVKISAGVLLQAVSSSVIYSHAFDGTDEVTIADAAGATPRVDLIQMKIEPDDTVDTTRTKVTISVKQGTPASPPVVPVLDSGYVAYATIVVGASYAHAAGFKFDDTTGAVAVLHDQRMPLGVQAYSAVGTELSRSNVIQDAVNGWTDDHSVQSITGATAAPGVVCARVPCTEDCGRFLMSMVYMFNPSGSAIVHQLVRDGVNSGGGHTIVELNGDPTGLATNAYTTLWTSRGDAENLHTPTTGPTVLPSADNVGAPLWSNGRRCWTPPPTIAGGAVTGAGGLAYKFSSISQTHKFYRAQFWIAGSS